MSSEETIPVAAAASQSPILVVADAHVKAGTPSRDFFFRMLEWISTTAYDVVFLGDIMELWIGVPSYESEMHRAFVAWCKEEKSRRKIFFLEGNHEYFVLAHHRECFTACGEDDLLVGETVFSHGDYQLAEDAHRRFRWWTKSWLAHFLLKFMPFAPAYVRHLKSKLERKSRERYHRFPGPELNAWGRDKFSQEDTPKAYILGHFHKGLCVKRNDGRLFAVLPAWKEQGEVGLYYPEDNLIFFRNWRSLQNASTSTK